jgi:hypothetical protein
MWDIEVAMSNLPDGCMVLQPGSTQEPITLVGNSADTLSVEFIFFFPMERAHTALTKLATQQATMELAISHRYRKPLRRKEQTAKASLSVAYAEVWASVKAQARIEHRDLALIAVHSEIDTTCNSAFEALPVTPEERLALRNGVWMLIEQPEYPLDYPLDGVTGRSRMLFRTGYAANAVYGDGTDEVFARIRKTHEEVVVRAQALVGGARGEFSLGSGT